MFNNPVNDTDPTGMASGMMAQIAALKNMSHNEWQQRQAQDSQSMAVAEATMSRLDNYTAMEDAFEFGISSGLAFAAQRAAKEAKKEGQDGQAQSGDGSGGDKIVVKLNVYRSSGTWDKGRAPGAMQNMLEAASAIYLKYGVTVEVNGQTDPAAFSVKVLADGPKDDVTFDQMKAILPDVSSKNEMNVLFTQTADCGARGGGCADPASHSILIPQRSENQDIVNDRRPSGLWTILAHEMGHVFGLDNIPGRFDSPYRGWVMFHDSKYRTDTGNFWPEEVQKMRGWFR